MNNKIRKKLVAMAMALVMMMPTAMPSVALAAPEVSGEGSTPVQVSASSENGKVTLDGEYTVAEVKNDLRRIILLGSDTVVNVSEYGIAADDMDILVAEVLEENYVSGLITVTCAVDHPTGIAEYLVIERSEALVTARDELDDLTENVPSDDSDDSEDSNTAVFPGISSYALEREGETTETEAENGQDTSGLTDDQKEELVSLYALYLQTYNDYPQYLGLLDPYFYTKNTETSPLGGMLVVAGIPQAAIDAGYVSYDDLFGCIMTFYLGNMATVRFYGSDLLSAKDEAIKAVEESGAKTYVDRLLVLTDWLANRASFDMPYIMNQSQKDEDGNLIEMMKAPSGNTKVNKFLASGDLEAYCEEILTPIFEQGALDDGREEGKKVGYAEYIKKNYEDAFNAVKNAEYQDENGNKVPKKDGNNKTVYEYIYDMVYEQAYQGTYDALINSGASEDDAKQQAADQADHMAVIEAEYAVAQQAAQILDSQSEGTGSEPAGGEPTGSEPAGDETTSSEPAGGETTGSEPAGGEPTGSEPTGGETTGSEPTDDETTGGESLTKTVIEEKNPVNNSAAQSDEAVILSDTEQTSVDAAATEYAEKYAEKYAKEYAANYASNVAPQYAAGLAPSVAGSWTGNLVGALCLDSCVCKSYTYAFNYIIQWMNPGVYGKNGDSTDLSSADNWKSADDLYYVSKENPAVGDNEETLVDSDGNPIITTEKTFSTDAGYVVDSVRITYNKSVTMYGEIADDFTSDHYWSAVKVDGEWYYIDSCYADIYIECMMRSRVETSGYINNLYFMISDASTREMYDGYYDSENGLDTLYDSRNNSGISDDTSYEHTWFSFAKSQVYSDGSGYYYMYDDTDALNELGRKNSTGDSDWDDEGPTEYRLVYRPMDSENSDEQGGESYVISDDKSAQILVDVNSGTYYDGESMVESDLLKELYARYQEYTENYPGVFVSMAYSNGIAYLSMGNTILAYDVSKHSLTRVLEYNDVYAVRDMDNAFGGMAFTVTDDADNAVLSILNPPITAINIVGDDMIVSLATNYAYISGKSGIDDDESYGYEFQETNYNLSYVNYSDYGVDLGDYGNQLDGVIEQQDNDNDEFMWAANFVDTISVNELAGTEHNYELVTVEPGCGWDGYSEYRCSDCGRICVDEEHPRTVNEDTAHEHHYVHFTETYYTKDNDSYKTGDTFVCSECLHSVNYDSSGDADNTEWESLKNRQGNGHVYTFVDTEDGQVKWADDSSSVTISGGQLVCHTCENKALDFLVKDSTSGISADGDRTVPIELDENETITCDASPDHHTGTCEEGITTVYVAECMYKDMSFTLSNSVKSEPGEHLYVAKFVWTEKTDEEGNFEGYTATAELTCDVCGDTVDTQDAEVTSESFDPTCTEEGKDVYTATLTYKDKTYTEQKEVATKKPLGHEYKAEFKWNGTDSATATVTCERCSDVKETVDCKITVTTKDATYVSDGQNTYTATAEYDGKTFTETKTETIKRKTMKTPVLTEAVSVAGGVNVTWSAVAGADSYQVYRRASGTGTWSKLGSPVKQTNFKDTSVKSGEIYFYTVSGIAGEGSSAVLSDYDKTGISVKYIAQPVLSGISNVSGGVKVTWNKVNGAEKYRLYVRNGNDWEAVTDTTETSATFKGTSKLQLTSGTLYCFTVRCVSADGKSNVSSYDTEGKTKKYIAQPVLSNISNVSGGVKVTWNKVNGAEKYRLYVRNGNDWEAVTDTTETSATFKGTSKLKLAGGTSYRFTVRCVSADGKSDVSSYDTKGKTILHLTVPKVTVSNNSSGAVVKWTKTAGAKGYYVYRKTKSGSYKKIATIKKGTTVSYTDSEVKSKNGTSYTYAVKAYNGSTLSSYSGKTIVRLSNPKTTVSNSSSGTIVKWTKITGAKGYYVYRKTKSGSYKKIATIKKGTTVSYTDTAVKNKNGTSYTYAVKAYNGSSVSSYNSKTIVRLTSPVISGLTNNKSRAITVKWKKNSSVTGYQVRYKSGTTTKTVTVKGKSNVSKVIKKLSKNKTYTVNVRCYKTVSGVNYYSGWSTSKTIKIKR
ncbi:MAG: hypothetical protein PUG60_05045 [Lachnospiraceae bacterium]|nr:hypothetical protein [Lachnospiraceae bacterium]